MMESFFYERSAAVTPSDNPSANLFVDDGFPHARALYIGGSGSLSVVTAGGDTVTFANVAVGELRLAVRQVKATGTSASGIVSLY